jgi:ribosomal protein S6
MALYDLMLILDAEAPDERRTEILDGIRQAIEADGALVESQDWGARHLAFEIGGREDGAYHLFQLEAAPPLLERLGRTLRITDDVLRFRLIRLKPGQPTPRRLAPTRAAATMSTETPLRRWPRVRRPMRPRVAEASRATAGAGRAAERHQLRRLRRG